MLHWQEKWQLARISDLISRFELAGESYSDQETLNLCSYKLRIARNVAAIRDSDLMCCQSAKTVITRKLKQRSAMLTLLLLEMLSLVLGKVACLSWPGTSRFIAAMTWN